MTAPTVPTSPDVRRYRSDRFPPRSYCLRVCLCGEHPDYKALPRPEADNVTHLRPDTRQATSWADRDEPTWLDR